MILSVLTGSTTTNAVGIATVTGTIGDILAELDVNVLVGISWFPEKLGLPPIPMPPSSFLTLDFPGVPPNGTYGGQLYYREKT